MTYSKRRAPLALLLAVLAVVAAAVALSGPLYAQGVSTAPSSLNATVVDGGVALSWDAPTTDVGTVTGYEVLRRRGGFGLLTYVDDTGTTVTSYTDSGAAERGQTYVYQVKALRDADASRGSNEATVSIPGTCPIRGSTPVEVTVSAVPIVVTSTSDDYFVLYVLREVEGEAIELPVLVKLGGDGTTTLTENVEALPKERYRVEKFRVADPADVDGDCVDDITELEDFGNKNPVNPAPAIDITNGTVAIPDRATFEKVSDGIDVDYLKIVLVNMYTDRPSIYFVNTETHQNHGRFMDTIGIDREKDSVLSAQMTYDSELLAPDGSSGVYYYWPYQRYPFSFAERTYALIAASMPLLEDNLALHIRNYVLSYAQPELPLYRASRLNLLFDEDVQGETAFLALNEGEGYGLLQVTEPGERPTPRDIVLYEALPNNLPRVAGIISTVFQTPLSHVNLRAVQDHIPNAFIRNALDDPDIASLLDSYVHYTLTEDEYTIRAATKAEVDAHYDASRPASAQTPERNLSVTGITALSDIGFDDWTAFGVKAANVAVLGTMGFSDGTVPDGFAVPIYFYDEFMKANDLYTEVETMLTNTDFQTDFGKQEEMLDDLRDAIKDGTTPAWIITALENMHDEFPEGTSLRYRSSTNNEDLPGFNGAGLYDSKTQDPEETDEDGIDKSIKGVWASLWNFRAFVERDFHRIDHTATAMGVLVHPNYSDELANGVAVSFDPIRGRKDSYYVNTQVGEDLVTNPEAHSTPEEVLLRDFGGYLVLATSNLVQPGELLMSGAHRRQLHGHLKAIRERFKALYNPATGKRFAMEIEFKITSDNILAIKQARPWVFRAKPPAFPRTETGNRAVPENSATGTDIGAPVAAKNTNGDTLTYSLGGGDAGSFSIVESSGQLRTSAALDYEFKDRYTVEVSVHDGKGPTGAADTRVDDTITVTVTVSNKEEAGTVTLPSDDPRVDLPLTADVEDPDGEVSVNTWRWERSSNGRSGWATITGETSATYTPVDGDTGYYLRATAFYDDRMRTAESAEAVSVNPVQSGGPPQEQPPQGESPVQPPPISGGGGGGFGPAPVAPKFGDGFRTTRSVAENAGPGDVVGDAVTATHPDDLEVTYSLSGTDASSFGVDEETGQIRVKDGIELAEGRTYTVNLTATDSAGFGAIIIIEIEVTEASFSPYDMNANDKIERDEVIMAVADYFKGLITKGEVIEVVKLYFSG